MKNDQLVNNTKMNPPGSDSLYIFRKIMYGSVFSPELDGREPGMKADKAVKVGLVLKT
jgi:hypothetical protein